MSQSSFGDMAVEKLLEYILAGVLGSRMEDCIAEVDWKDMADYNPLLRQLDIVLVQL